MEAALKSENVKHAAKIFEENSDMIRIAIRSKVNDRSVIDDIFQNLFISLCHSPVPSNIENTEAYLRRAIRNDVIDAAIQRKCPKGLEPSTFGSTGREPKDLTADITKTCANSKSALTQKLTPTSRKQSEIDISKFPEELSEIVNCWHDLPKHIRQAICTLVRSSK